MPISVCKSAKGLQTMEWQGVELIGGLGWGVSFCSLISEAPELWGKDLELGIFLNQWKFSQLPTGEVLQVPLCC